MSTMHFADEVAPVSEIDGVPSGRSKPAPKELRLASQIIDALASDWDPTRYHDTYTEELRDRLETLVEWTLVADKQEALTGDWGLWFDLWGQAFRHPEVKKDRAELDAQWRDLIARIVQEGIELAELEPSAA